MKTGKDQTALLIYIACIIAMTFLISWSVPWIKW